MSGIDLHTHLAPLIDDEQRGGLTGVEHTGGRLVLDGHPVGPPDLYRAEKLLAYLDEAGLDEAVVAIPPPFYRQHLPQADAAVWVRAVNEGLKRMVGRHQRLTPLAYLPFEHPELALAEYERVRGDNGFAGVAAAAGGRSVSLADPVFDALWTRLDADRRMLLLHPGTAPDPRLDPFYLANLLGNPAETALATGQLVFGDVLARYPGMRVLLVHCGGCVPAVVGRWQRGVDTERPGLVPLRESPVTAVRRLYIDCLAHDPAVVDLAVTVFGEDKLVLGSDWPFPMGTRDPAGLVAHRGDESVRGISVDHARAVLGRP